MAASFALAGLTGCGGQPPREEIVPYVRQPEGIVPGKGEAIEHAFRHIARELARKGVRKFVVAGGETSGAVVEALGVRALAIGPEIDPGVPWTVSQGGEPYLLALKSGNFGSAEFFAKALEMVR